MKAFPLLLATLLSACASLRPPAGRDFPRSAVNLLELQRTTLPEVEAAMGPPWRMSSITGPAGPHDALVPPGMPVDITIASYVYEPYGPSRPGAPAPVRTAMLAFFGGRLFAYGMASNIPGEESPPIDDARLAQLTPGVTTRDAARTLLGPPDSAGVLITTPNTTKSHFDYTSSVTEGGMVHRRMLRLEFDNARRFVTYQRQESSFPVGSAPLLLPGPTAPVGPPPIARPLQPYAGVPGRT